MKPLILSLFVFFISLQLTAQESYSALVRDTSTFRLDLGFMGVGIGPNYAKLNSNLPDPSAYLLNTRQLSLSSWLLLDLQFIYKDKVGFETGYYGLKMSYNSKKIRNDFQEHVSDYTITFKERDSDGADPINGDFNFHMVKLGIVGFLQKRKIAFLPYCDYLLNIESDYPSLKINFTQAQTNYSFTREYNFDNINTYGFRIGCAARVYGEMNRIRKTIKPRIILGVFTDLVFVQARGIGYYIDTDTNGNVSRSNENKFRQNFFTVNVGIVLGLLDFHWK